MEEFWGKLLGNLVVWIPLGYALWHTIYRDRQDKNDKIAKKIKDYISYDEETKTLSVYDFHPQIYRVVTMEPYEILHTAYQPETYTYTSVRVGNVTVGDVRKNDAYKYIAGSSKTSKYELMYRRKSIEKIKLCSQNVRDKAKQARMGEYMNRAGEIVVVESPTSISREALSAAISGSYAQMQIEGLGAYPSYDKCKYILDFLNSAKGQPVPKEKMSPAQKKTIKYTLLGLLVFFLLLGIIGGGMLLGMSTEAYTSSVFNDWDNIYMNLVDPADLGLKGKEGYVCCDDGSICYFTFYTVDDNNQEYFYAYTVDVKRRKGDDIWLKLVLAEEGTYGIIYEDDAPPKSIAGLRLVATKDTNTDEYAYFVLADQHGNALAHSPNVEIKQSGE